MTETEVQFSITEWELTEIILRSFDITDPNTVNNFKEQNINQSLFQYLHYQDLPFLLPTVRERCIFRKGVEEYIKKNVPMSYTTNEVFMSSSANDIVSLSKIELVFNSFM